MHKHVHSMFMYACKQRERVVNIYMPLCTGKKFTVCLSFE